jgi:hypothetical protein
VWNDLFSDWHQQRVDERSNRINMLFATQHKHQIKTSKNITCNSLHNEKNGLKSPKPL